MTPKSFYLQGFLIGVYFMMMGFASIFSIVFLLNSMLTTVLNGGQAKYRDDVSYKTFKDILVNCSYLSWSFILSGYMLMRYCYEGFIDGLPDAEPPRKAGVAFMVVYFILITASSAYNVYEIFLLSNFQSTMIFYIPYLMVTVYLIGVIGLISLGISLCLLYRRGSTMLV